MGRWFAILAGLLGGLLGIWKRPPLLAILAINLIPVAGVLWFGWSPLALLLLYWAENVFVGVFNTLKLRGYERHRGSGGEPFKLSGFFIIHYGIFTLVHGIFAVIVGTLFFGTEGAEAAGAGLRGGRTETLSYLIALASIGVLHLIDFLRWRSARGWEHGSADAQMFAPYGRIVVMHLTVLGGAAVLAATHAPATYIALMAVLKTFIETGWAMLGDRQAAGGGMTIAKNGRTWTRR